MREKPKTDIRGHFDPDIKGYASYENAMKKLLTEVPVDMKDRPITLIMVNSVGRFIPVAVGRDALHHGLHLRGVAVVA